MVWFGISVGYLFGRHRLLTSTVRLFDLNVVKIVYATADPPGKSTVLTQHTHKMVQIHKRIFLPEHRQYICALSA